MTPGAGALRPPAPPPWPRPPPGGEPYSPRGPNCSAGRGNISSCSPLKGTRIFFRDIFSEIFFTIFSRGSTEPADAPDVSSHRNFQTSAWAERDLEGDQQQTLAMLAATEKVRDLPLWRSAEDRKPIPGVDVVRTGEHPDPMFDNTGGRTFGKLQ